MIFKNKSNEMLVDLPLWGLVLAIFAPLIIGFIILKMVGVKILYSIALSLIVPVILVFVIHTFDVIDGKLVPHIGDFFVAIFLVVAIGYWVLLVLYIIIYHIIRQFCCNPETMDKIKAAYDVGTDNSEGGEASPKFEPPISDKLENPDDFPPPSVPIDITVFNDEKNFDNRSLAGSLTSTS
jgi:hypothetical protein